MLGILGGSYDEVAFGGFALGGAVVAANDLPGRQRRAQVYGKRVGLWLRSVGAMIRYQPTKASAAAWRGFIDCDLCEGAPTVGHFQPSAQQVCMHVASFDLAVAMTQG